MRKACGGISMHPLPQCHSVFWDRLSCALFGAVTLWSTIVVPHYSVSNDEPVQRHYGELIARYYASGFVDQSLFHYDNLYLYGGLFDLAAFGAAKLFGTDIYATRHVLCALCGLAGIAAAMLTARMIAGSRPGFLAGLLFAVSGSWIGAMFNHTKDIPLAAAASGAIYFIIRAMRDKPKPRMSHVCGFGLCLGLALGIKVVGLLLIVFLGIAIAARFIINARSSGLWSLMPPIRMAVAFVPALLIGYVIMAITWPYSALAPLNPLRAIVTFAHFDLHIPTILDGQLYELSSVPRWYVPAYLAIKLPIPLLIGAILAIFILAKRTINKSDTCGAPSYPQRLLFETGLIACFAILPLALQVIGRGPAVTGLRHFLFVVPPMTVLAALGFEAAWRALRASRAKLLAAIMAIGMAVWIAWIGVTLIRLHPYEYVYYNEFVGGLAGAHRRYVGDYWVNIMRPAVRTLSAYVAAENARTGHSGEYPVAVCGEREAFLAEPHRGLVWTADWNNAAFFIAPTHMNCDRVLNGKIIESIDRLGISIGVVKDLRGFVSTLK